MCDEVVTRHDASKEVSTLKHKPDELVVIVGKLNTALILVINAELLAINLSLTVLSKVWYSTVFLFTLKMPTNQIAGNFPPPL